MKSSLLELLNLHQQSQLLDSWDSLNEVERTNLSQQIQNLDFKLIHELHLLTSKSSLDPQSASEIKPMPFMLASEDPKHDYWLETGSALLEQGQVGAFLVAGGQGSRLGFEGPKGVYDIGLPSHKSIFQYHAERLLRLKNLFGIQPAWCIMTSPLNHAETIAHFEENQYFGLEASRVRFFSQALLPALNSEGKILLESPAQIALVPDGNGGCFRALSKSGSLDWLSDLGVRYLFLTGVDNVLVKVCDPLFIGALATQTNYLSASKVIAKSSPEEKVGIFAYNQGKPCVIEYSDLPAELREKRNDDGSLTFDGGNIAVHLFKIEALRQLENQPLPWHVAHKKVSFWNATQGKVEPTSPNAFKFEQFLFDAFPILGSMLPMGVVREQEFAPVKNAEGADSPATARSLIGRLHRKWLINAGMMVNSTDLYEVSPLLSYQGEGLNAKVVQKELGKGILRFEA